MYQQAEGIAFVMIPLLTKLAVHSLWSPQKTDEGKQFYFLPFLVDFFFKETVQSPLSVLRKLFSFILVCTFFKQNIFDLVSEELFIEHVLRFTAQNQDLISGCSG